MGLTVSIATLKVADTPLEILDLDEALDPRKADVLKTFLSSS